MSRDRLAIAALGALVIAALATGIFTVGGPGTGAMEKRDDARIFDLMRLRDQVSCIRNGEPGALPETLEPTPECDFGANITDPRTGNPYRYERMGADNFRICADFENAERVAQQIEPRMAAVEENCLIFTPEPWRELR